MSWIALVLVILVAGGPAAARLRTWVVDEAGEFALGTARGVQVHPDSLVILARLTGDENLALGRPVVDEFGKQVPLSDGSVAQVRSEWLSGSPNVFGRNFTLDLGLDRALIRVRILAGETARNQPEYFVRGYRLEAAPQEAPQVWRLLAEQPENFKLNVDTSLDSTWNEVDAQGMPVAQQGRFVRLTLIRQDRSNWVALGELEVFGVGFASDGTIEDGFTPPTPVNVGRIRWQAESPARTRIELRVRGSAAGRPAAPWEEVDPAAEREFLFAGDEPVARFEYRVRLQNDTPYRTPVLRRVEVEYDPTLVVHRLLGSVTGLDRVHKGVPVALVYRVRADVAAGDYGIDLLRLRGAALRIESLRIDARTLVQDPTLTQGFRSRDLPEQEETLIELAPQERIESPATLEIQGEGLFLRDRTPVELEAGSRSQREVDGYVNWQRGQEEPSGSWTVLAGGAPLKVLSRVAVEPRPFSPYAGTPLRFDVVVSNIEEGRRITLEILSLDGRRVRWMEQTGRSRAYRFEWDGRDRDGRVVRPGLYLYQLEVGRSGAARRGTFAVAY